MYELGDLLSEIKCIKSDPQFSALFAFYGTSSVVNLIISNLPVNLQNKWIDRTMKYKQTNNVVFRHLLSLRHSSLKSAQK